MEMVGYMFIDLGSHFITYCHLIKWHLFPLLLNQSTCTSHNKLQLLKTETQISLFLKICGNINNICSPLKLIAGC